MKNFLTKELEEKLNGLEDESLKVKKEIIMQLYNQCIEKHEDNGTEGIIMFFKFKNATVIVWSSEEYGGINFKPDNREFIDFCRHIYGVEVEEEDNEEEERKEETIKKLKEIQLKLKRTKNIKFEYGIEENDKIKAVIEIKKDNGETEKVSFVVVND